MNKRLGTIAATVIALFIPTIALAQAIPKPLKQGMPYAQARKMLINAGWRVKPFSNRDRSGTMNYLITKLGYNEVESCSGTGMGYCRLNFTGAQGQTLAVVTVNNQTGHQPKLQRWWIEPRGGMADPR